jgi:hypothetical protein
MTWKRDSEEAEAEVVAGVADMTGKFDGRRKL